jgi:hypothetical protein
MSQTFFSRDRFFGEKAIVVYFIALKLILCLLPSISFFLLEYGYFRDELYYIALSDNLDFGYVDVPPIVPFLLAVVRHFLGTSFLSLHLLPAVCGALVVWIVSLMVKKMGGGINALLLTLACVTVAPIYICWESVYSYDAFDKLWWTLALYMMVLLIKTDDKRYWIYFGIVAGLGLLTKISILFLGFGICVALLATNRRKYFLSWQIWVAGVIAFLIFSPYLLWQIKEGLPALEYYRAYASGKTAAVTPAEFIKNQVVVMNPLAFPIWLSGLGYFILNKRGKEFRVFGYAYLVILILCIYLQVKFYLPAPFYTVLFAGGAVSIESFARRRGFGWLKKVPAVLVLLLGLASVPFVRPVLPVKTLMKYSGRGVYMGVKGERHRLGRLHQHFADRFGWEEMASAVAKAYNSLSEEDKSKAGVLAGNYGEAGAIWLFGEQYHLPKPISGHLQYYLWGPRGCSGEVLLSIGVDEDTLKNNFGSVRSVVGHECLLAIRYERYLRVYLCTEPKKPLGDMWPNFKHMD